MPGESLSRPVFRLFSIFPARALYSSSFIPPGFFLTFNFCHYFFYTLLTVKKLITKSSPVAKKVPVHLTVIPAQNPSYGAISFTYNSIAAKTAVDTYRRRICQIPFTGVMILQRFISEYPGGTYFDKVSAEFTLKYSLPEISRNIHGLQIPIHQNHFPRHNPCKT